MRRSHAPFWVNGYFAQNELRSGWRLLTSGWRAIEKCQGGRVRLSMAAILLVISSGLEGERAPLVESFSMQHKSPLFSACKWPHSFCAKPPFWAGSEKRLRGSRFPLLETPSLAALRITSAHAFNTCVLVLRILVVAAARRRIV